VWGETITGVLSQLSPDVLFALLSELREGGDTSQLEGLLDAIGGSPPSWQDEVMMGLFRPVACTEIAEDSWFGFELVDGEVIPTVNACDAIDLTAPFDAADWPIDAPILYFQGDRDPATAIDGARAHFSAQADTDRTFVTVHGIGHTPLSWSIADSCGTTTWDAILAGDDLGAVLEACGVDATVEHAAAAR
jgi:pimeloyl-ACP methyl ester carboxylesterase